MARDVCTSTFDAVLELDTEYVSGDDELARFRRSSLGPQPCWFFALWMSCWKWFFLGCSCRPCVVVEFMRSSGTVVVCLSELLSSASHRTRTQHTAHNMTQNGHMTVVPTNQSTHRSNHTGRTVPEIGHEDQREHHTLTHNMSCS